MPELAMPSTRNEVSFARCTHWGSGFTTSAAPQWSPVWWSSMGPYGPTIVPSADKIGAHGSKNLEFLAKLFVFRGKIWFDSHRHQTAYSRCLILEYPGLAPKHPNTLTSVNNLALVLASQSKYEDAESMHGQALRDQETVLGPTQASIHAQNCRWPSVLHLILGSSQNLQ